MDAGDILPAKNPSTNRKIAIQFRKSKMRFASRLIIGLLIDRKIQIGS